MGEKTFSTKDFRLAVWLLYQNGVEPLGIDTTVQSQQIGRDGRPRCRSRFNIDLSNCTNSLETLLRQYHTPGQALVDVRVYEELRSNLMADMHRVQRQALEAKADADGD